MSQNPRAEKPEKKGGITEAQKLPAFSQWLHAEFQESLKTDADDTKYYRLPLSSSRSPQIDVKLDIGYDAAKGWTTDEPSALLKQLEPKEVKNKDGKPFMGLQALLASDLLAECKSIVDRCVRSSQLA